MKTTALSDKTVLIYVGEDLFVNDSVVLTNLFPWCLFFHDFIIMNLTFLLQAAENMTS